MMMIGIFLNIYAMKDNVVDFQTMMLQWILLYMDMNQQCTMEH